MQEENSNYITYLINLSIRGRKNSFMELCKLNIETIYALILRLVSDVPLAIDLTIDVFMSSWENLNHFRSDIIFSDWLKGIAVYMVLEEVRTKERKKIIEKEAKISSAKTKPAPKPTSTNKLENMIFSLGEIQRIVFVLHDMEGYSCSEISDFIGGTSEKKIKEELKNTRRELITRL